MWRFKRANKPESANSIKQPVINKQLLHSSQEIDDNLITAGGYLPAQIRL